MELMWCSLPVFLAVVAGMVVMGQSTRETLETSESVEPADVEVIPNTSKSESTTERSSTLATLYPTSAPLTDAPESPVQLNSTTGPLLPRTSVSSTMGYLSHTTQDITQQANTGLMESSTSPGLEAETDVNRDTSSTNGSEHWATDEPGNGTGTPEVTSASTAIGTGTPEVTSATTAIGTGTPEVTSNSTAIGTGTPEVTSNSTAIGTGTPEVTSASTAVTNTTEIGGHVQPGVKLQTQPPPTSKTTSAKKQTKGVHPATTAAPTMTAIKKGNESIPLKPTIPFVRKITKATTRSYKRLSTAQATTKKIGLVTQCLIAITILAAICTVFVICTIVLCTKISSQRHNYRVNSSNGTELVCISALLPEEERKLRKKMKPKRLRDFKEISTGHTSDSDDDDLTLHSFVTEH